MRIATIQFKGKKGQPEASWQALLRLIESAGEKGAQLIVCPEMALTGYLFTDPENAARVAEPAQGEGLRRLGELAARYRTHIVCGYPELAMSPASRVGTRRLYNAARVIGADGALLYNYRKRLLYESDFTWATPGDTPYPLIELCSGKILCVGICMDLNDDRFTAFLRSKKPHLVAFCTNWLDEGLDVLPYWQWRLSGTHSYFLAANTYGEEEAPGHKKTRFSGRSAILSPGGHLLARGPDEGDAVMLADLI